MLLVFNNDRPPLVQVMAWCSRANVDQFIWYQMASLCHNELTYRSKRHVQPTPLYSYIIFVGYLGKSCLGLLKYASSVLSTISNMSNASLWIIRIVTIYNTQSGELWYMYCTYLWADPPCYSGAPLYYIFVVEIPFRWVAVKLPMIDIIHCHWYIGRTIRRTVIIKI